MLDSLRSRLALSNLLITLAGLLIVVVVSVNLFEQRMTDTRTRELVGETRGVAHEVEMLFRHKGSVSQLRAQIVYASEILQKRVIIVSTNGDAIVDSAGATPFYTGTWHPVNAGALRSGRRAIAALSKGNLVTVQQPIRGTSGMEEGAVLVVAQVKDVRPSLSAIVPILLVALGTALLVWLLIGLYFAYSVSRPLSGIREATRQVARGDYDVRVPETGAREISRLATSFNLMAAQVRQTNQVLKDFVANVSHDLRTPLTMIGGFSEALLDGTAGPGEVETSAEIIHQEAQKMQVLVDDLLQLTRLESGLVALDCHPTALEPLVDTALSRARRAHSRELHLVNAVPSLPPVRVDPMRLERALGNLLDNACRYTPAGGRIEVGARVLEREWIEVWVKDTGSGIAREHLGRVFERFYRSDPSRERAGGHSGLGLAIVREIVEAHSGTVRVESEVGRGTTFYLTLPVARSSGKIGSSPSRVAS